MLRETKENHFPMQRIKAIVSKFVSVVIVGSLLNMPYTSSIYFAQHNLKTETQEITKTSVWSATAKTIDLYLRPFDESVRNQQYSEKPLVLKNFPNIFIKNITKPDTELQERQEAYIAYSESTAQILDKSYIIFPFHYFW